MSNIDSNYALPRDAAGAHDITLHAYAFMGNHFHLLLISPQPDALSRAMHDTDPCSVQAFNRCRRSGTPWQERFKSCLVDTERYMMPVDCYIGLNAARVRC